MTGNFQRAIIHDLEAERRFRSVAEDLPKFEAVDQTFRAALDREFGALGVKQIVERPSHIFEADDEDYELPGDAHPMSA